MDGLTRSVYGGHKRTNCLEALSMGNTSGRPHVNEHVAHKQSFFFFF